MAKMHTKAWKENELKSVASLIGKYSVIGVADLENFPADLFQKLRKQLNGKVEFTGSKQRVIKKAFEQSKLKESGLLDSIKGSCAIIATNLNPFELYAILKKNSGKIGAKPGIIAPFDIIVPAGDTGLPPGPALSDLKQAGLPVKVQGATISIPEDTVVAKKGEIIKPVVASTLAKLDIKPIKVMLGLVCAYEEGQLYKADVLDIDMEKQFEKFCTAHRNALALALEIAYCASATTPLLLQKAHRNALAVALESSFPEKEVLPMLLQKAEMQANAIKAKIPEVPEVSA